MKSLRQLRLLTLVAASVVGVAQQPAIPTAQDTDVMILAASRDKSMLRGGISSSTWTRRGTLVVEPIARLSAAGEWKSLPCDSRSEKACRKFEREFLKKAHSYEVISADGKGATILSAPTTLSECSDYSGNGSYSGAEIASSAIAAPSSEFFAEMPAAQPLPADTVKAIQHSLSRLIPTKLDSTKKLRYFGVQLEGQSLVVIQRAYTDYADARDERMKLIFAIATNESGRFQVLHWKKNTVDEDERVVGTIRLKAGRDFLITVVSDPESHWYRVYGIRNGRLTIVYTGGGSGC